MGRKSTLEREPQEVQDLIAKLRKNGRTLDEIMEKLQELDVQVSRSSLARYTKRHVDAITNEIRNKRILAEALVERFGDAPDDKTSRLNIELMHAQLTRLMFPPERGKPVTLNAQEAYFISTSLQRLAQAQKLDAERILKIQEDTAKKAAERAVEIAKKLAAEKGVTLGKEALDQIRKEVGIVR